MLLLNISTKEIVKMEIKINKVDATKFTGSFISNLLSANRFSQGFDIELENSHF